MNEKQKLIALFATHQSLHWFIVGLIVPVVALLQLEKGINLFQLGLIMASNSATVIALELPTGGLADILGRKKVYLYSQCFYVVGLVVLLFAQSFVFLIVGFVLLGIARALSSGSMDAWFVDEFIRINPSGNLQSAFAIVGIFVPISLGLGAIVGGILPDTLGKLIANVAFFDLYSANLLLMFVIVFVQFVFTTIKIKDRFVYAEKKGIMDGFRELPKVMATAIQYGVQNRVVLLLLITTAAIGVALAGLENFWQPQLKELFGGVPKMWVFGLLSAGYFFSAALGNAVVTPICRMFGNNYRIVLFVSRIAMALVWFVLALQSRVAGFSAMYVTVFLFNGLSTSPHAALFNGQIPEERRSTLLSFESLVLQLGAVFGSTVMGYIAEIRSISFAWYVGSSILLLSAVAYLLLPKGEKSALQ